MVFGKLLFQLNYLLGDLLELFSNSTGNKGRIKFVFKMGYEILTTVRSVNLIVWNRNTFTAENSLFLASN